MSASSGEEDVLLLSVLRFLRGLPTFLAVTALAFGLAESSLSFLASFFFGFLAGFFFAFFASRTVCRFRSSSRSTGRKPAGAVSATVRLRVDQFSEDKFF